MTLREIFWRLILDPIARKIDRRIAHFRSLERTTHDGLVWNNVADIQPGCVFYPDASLQNLTESSKLAIGANCCVRGEVLVLQTGRFTLGHHSFIGSGSRVWCRENVSIGSHVLISHLVDIHDSDSHSLNWEERQREGIMLFGQGIEAVSGEVRSSAIIVEDDVWIGFKSSILKGVTIGRGAVVAAGSVVTKDVPAFTLVAGNPARVVRELDRKIR